MFFLKRFCRHAKAIKPPGTAAEAVNVESILVSAKALKAQKGQTGASEKWERLVSRSAAILPEFNIESFSKLLEEMYYQERNEDIVYILSELEDQTEHGILEAANFSDICFLLKYLKLPYVHFNKGVDSTHFMFFIIFTQVFNSFGRVLATCRSSFDEGSATRLACARSNCEYMRTGSADRLRRFVSIADGESGLVVNDFT